MQKRWQVRWQEIRKDMTFYIRVPIRKSFSLRKNIWEMTWMRRMFYRMPMCRHLQN